jgi:hypothetical protein
MKNNPEAELAKEVIKHFESLGYITYKEVSLSGGGSIRADIFCKKEDESIAIEVKMNMCLKIIEQGFKWREHCNKTYIVISKKGKPNLFAEMICRDYGIGLIYCKNGIITERIPPLITKDPKEPKLYEEQLLSLASNNKGDFITPFRLTHKRLVDYVGDKKLILSEVISNIDHHYKDNQSAANSIKSMIKIGVIELSIVKESGKIWIFKIK